MTIDTTLHVIELVRPNARQRPVTITEVNPEVVAFFKGNNIKITCEQITPHHMCFYADYGALMDDDETPREAMYLSFGKSINDTLTGLMNEVKAMQKDETNEVG